MAKALYEQAKSMYPSCGMNELEWIAVFDEHPDILWAIVGDVYDAVKTEQEKDGGLHRMGRRPARMATSMEDVYATVFPPNYSVDPFPLAFEKLLNGRSQRQLALRIPCNQGTISRLLSGQTQPDLVMMERVALACKVPPHFFTEYRAQLIGAMVARVLTDQPNMGVTAMKRVRATRRELNVV